MPFFDSQGLSAHLHPIQLFTEVLHKPLRINGGHLVDFGGLTAQRTTRLVRRSLQTRSPKLSASIEMRLTSSTASAVPTCIHSVQSATSQR